MTRDEILEYFKDVNHAYNDCTRYDTLKCMLDELQEPCGDAISRDKAIVQLSHLLSDWDDDWNVVIRKCIETVKIVPPVTAEKVGQWIFHESFDKGHKNCNECIECSQCHTWLGHDCYAKTPYCPICGAKMQEVEDGSI